MWPFKKVDPIPATETWEQLRDRFYRADGDGQRAIMRGLKARCERLGHDLGEVKAVFSSQGRKGADELGNPIAYHARLCQRCGMRQPVSDEDAKYKEEMDAVVLAIFRQYHGSRAQIPENFDSPF